MSGRPNVCCVTCIYDTLPNRYFGTIKNVTNLVCPDVDCTSYRTKQGRARGMKDTISEIINLLNELNSRLKMTEQSLKIIKLTCNLI